MNTQTRLGRFRGNDPFEPTTAGSKRFNSLWTERDLIDYSQAYAQFAVDYYGLSVDQAHIARWDVSRQNVTTAAQTVRANLENHLPVEVGEPVDWETARQAVDTTLYEFSQPKDVSVALSWQAYRSLSEAEWQAVIRHELIHIEQYHQYGVTDHGEQFCQQAGQLDTIVRCDLFGDYTYNVICPACGRRRNATHTETDTVQRVRKGEVSTPCCGEPAVVREAS